MPDPIKDAAPSTAPVDGAAAARAREAAPTTAAAGHDQPDAAWVSLPWMGFDTETTGVSTRRDRIVTAAAVTAPASGTATAIRTWLANPGVPIPSAASQIHGVTTEHARAHGRDPRTVLEEVNEHLAAHMTRERIVVVFNASFDLPLLEAESRRHGVVALSERLGGALSPVADPLVLDRALDRYRKGKRTLAAMAQAYGVPLPQDTHQAHVDAQLAIRVLAAMVRQHSQLRSMGTGQLMDFQHQAHSDWAQDFERYLASKGRSTHIDRRWI